MRQARLSLCTARGRGVGGEGEDAFVQSRFQGKPTIYQSGGWEQNTGIPFPGIPPAITPEWASALKMDLATFPEYAEAVFAATDA